MVSKEAAGVEGFPGDVMSGKGRLPRRIDDGIRRYKSTRKCRPTLTAIVQFQIQVGVSRNNTVPPPVSFRSSKYRSLVCLRGVKCKRFVPKVNKPEWLTFRETGTRIARTSRSRGSCSVFHRVGLSRGSLSPQIRER